jgi:hypothetical protein
MLRGSSSDSDCPPQCVVLPEIPDYNLYYISCGAFSKVFKCVDRNTGEILALKVTNFDNKFDGIPTVFLREISVLK